MTRRTTMHNGRRRADIYRAGRAWIVIARRQGRFSGRVTARHLTAAIDAALRMTAP